MIPLHLPYIQEPVRALCKDQFYLNQILPAYEKFFHPGVKPSFIQGPILLPSRDQFFFHPGTNSSSIQGPILLPSRDLFFFHPGTYSSSIQGPNLPSGTNSSIQGQILLPSRSIFIFHPGTYSSSIQGPILPSRDQFFLHLKYNSCIIRGNLLASTNHFF